MKRSSLQLDLIMYDLKSKLTFKVQIGSLDRFQRNEKTNPANPTHFDGAI